MTMDRPSPTPHPNCYWVTPGQLLAGEYPSRPRDEGGGLQKIISLLEAGIRCFIDLTEPHELEPYEPTLRAEADARGLSVTYWRMSIRDVSVPKTAQEMVQILDAIDQALAAGQPVYVHCWGGVGRTGTVVGCHMVRRGLGGEAALQEVARLWQRVSQQKRAWHPRSPETAEQEDFVRHFRDKLRNVN